MRSISRHITPLVISSLGCGHTHTQTRTPTIRTGSILRNQARGRRAPGLKILARLEYFLQDIFTGCVLLLCGWKVAFLKSSHKWHYVQYQQKPLSISRGSSLWIFICFSHQLATGFSYMLMNVKTQYITFITWCQMRSSIH